VDDCWQKETGREGGGGVEPAIVSLQELTLSPRLQHSRESALGRASEEREKKERKEERGRKREEEREVE
jgi:hypothetical protein